MSRKHLNCCVIWPKEMEVLTLTPFDKFKSSYYLLENKYAVSFSEHAASHRDFVKNRQKLESPKTVERPMQS